MRRAKLILFLVFISFQGLIAQTRSVSPTTSTTAFYTNNTVQKFELTLQLQSQDNAFCDSLSVQFPVGTQILSAPTFISYLQTEGQSPEPLVASSVGTHILSYGTNHNNRGGIEVGIHTFEIEVVFPASLTGNQVINWYVSSDEVGAPPHFFTTQNSISPLPNQPDLAIEGSLDHPFYQLPKKEFNQVNLRSNITNNGTNYNQQNQLLINHLETSTLEVETHNFQVNYQKNQVIHLTEDYPFNTGINRYTFQLFDSNDFDNSNNRDTLQITTTDSTYTLVDSREIKPLPSALSVEKIGQIVSFPVHDTLTSISFQILEPSPNDSISAQIFRYENGTISQLVYTTETKIIPTAFPSFYTFRVPNLTFDEQDSFFVSLDLSKAPNTAPAMGKGSFLSAPDQFRFNGNWVPTDSLHFPYKMNVFYHVGNTETLCKTPFTVQFMNGYAGEFTAENTSFDFRWSVDSAPVGTGPTLYHDFTQAGTYTVCLEASSSNCRAQVCKEITVIYNHVSIVNAQSTEVSVYPSPAHEKVSVKSTSKIDKIMIFSLFGSLISEQSVNGNQTSVDVSTWKSGVYILQVCSNDKKTQNLRLVVSH